MAVARFRFYADLNDFLPPQDRGREVARTFDVGGSVKDMIESFGVPHTEVDLVVRNGEPVDFAHRVGDGDRVSVYPLFASAGPWQARLLPPPPDDYRFVCDVHLGRLAAYLRMAGFDALYRNDVPRMELAAIASGEDRILLTRDRYLLMRGDISRGYWVRAEDPAVQLVEVLRRFPLAAAVRPFTRCMKCNDLLEPADRGSVPLPPDAPAEGPIHICTGCSQIYWQGSHHARMGRFLEAALARASSPPVVRVSPE